ncbi:MAG: hypothetical protein L3J39_05775 [Verrucomicrobiales bacterium]|nr:hypothetical protein [Verrucomicrobiales bacterium]
MEITNNTKKPLRVPLPGGKKLFLSPGKSGQITPAAAARPAVVKLLEAGDVEISEEGAKRQGSASSSSSVQTASRDGRSGAMRQSGDK